MKEKERCAKCGKPTDEPCEMKLVIKDDISIRAEFCKKCKGTIRKQFMEYITT